MEAVSQQPPDYCMACGDCGLTMDYTGMVWNGVILPGPGQDTGTRGMCELTNQSRLLLSTKTCKNILVISINKHNMPHLTVNVWLWHLRSPAVSSPTESCLWVLQNIRTHTHQSMAVSHSLALFGCTLILIHGQSVCHLISVPPVDSTGRMLNKGKVNVLYSF